MSRSALAPRTKKPRDWCPRVKVWLEAEGEYAFGHGIAEILDAVERTGSIKQAAHDLRKSYRYIWGRIKKAEKTIGLQLVQTQVGGKEPQRSFLTPTARDLLADFQRLRRRMIQVVDEEFSQAFRFSRGSRSG